jgi:hypothetical protein
VDLNVRRVFFPPHIILENLFNGDKLLATVAIPTDFINTVATEMSNGVERAVEYWLAQIDQIVLNDKITPELKVTAVQEVLQNYQRLIGKGPLKFARIE